MINDSESLVTPREAFCRILEVIRPENPGLGKTVTGPHWIYEDRDEADTLACQNALRFLEANVSAGKIRAEGKRPRSDGPVEIRQSELRTGNPERLGHDARVSNGRAPLPQRFFVDG
jgi:hypothetical protein